MEFPALFASLPLVWILAATLCLGMGSAYLARLSAGTSHEIGCQLLFLVALAGVATAAVVSCWINAGLWYLSGGTLAAMVVLATYDGQPYERHAT